MDIVLNDAAIGTGLGAEVPPLTLRATAGVPSYVRVETAERPLLVSLIAGGRLRLDSGTTNDADALRLATALVDTPVVSEPTAGVSVASVVAEELVFASQPAGRRAVRDFLERHALADYARVPVRSLPPTERVRVLSELALLRPGVKAIIVTSPERHGGEPSGWYDELAAIAARGITVLIVTDAVTADTLSTLGAVDATAIPEPEPELELELEEPESPEPLESPVS